MSILSLRLLDAVRHSRDKNQGTIGSQLEIVNHSNSPAETSSQRQLAIYQTDEGGLIITLGGTNGSQLNQQPLQPVLTTCWRDGDVVKLAKSEGILTQIIVERKVNETDMANDKQVPTIVAKESASGMYFDQAESLFFVDGQPMRLSPLSPLEHDLLKYLYDNAERVCSYPDISQNVWRGWVGKASIVKLISNLRKKLNGVSAGAGERYLRTSRGHLSGYFLTQK